MMNDIVDVQRLNLGPTSIAQLSRDISDVLTRRFEDWLDIFSILKIHFRQIASIEKARAKRFSKATDPLRTQTYSPLVVTLFQGISIKNELMHSVIAGRVDAYETGILAEVGRLITEVERFIAMELKEGVKGGKDVARRGLKFECTHSQMIQGLRGAKHVNWFRDRAPIEFLFGNSFQYWHDPVILARLCHSRYRKWIKAKEEHHKEIYLLQRQSWELEKQIVGRLKAIVLRYTMDLPSLDDPNQIRLMNQMKRITYLDPVDEWEAFCRRENLLMSSIPDPTPEWFPRQDHPDAKPLMTILLQRRTTVLRRWSNSELWAVTRSGYLHHIHADPSTCPRPFRTLDLTRQGMSISVPIRLNGGMSTFEISWLIQPVYIRGMRVTDGTWKWTFQGDSLRVDSFVLKCHSLIAEHNSADWADVYPTLALEIPARVREENVNVIVSANVSDAPELAVAGLPTVAEVAEIPPELEMR